jgi:hypothetical protein
MTAREIAARSNAAPSGDGNWIARCPAHDDRSPSLSIAEGREGRVLMFCHAGCEIDAIARALGIELRDLFGDNAPTSWRSLGVRYKATAAELGAALSHEAKLYRKGRGIKGDLLTPELNAVRRTVAIKLGVVLDDLPRLLHEGSYGGRERDPAWPAIFEWAAFVTSAELLGVAVSFDGMLRPPRIILLAAEDRAAAAMRSLEREARATSREVRA